LVRRWAMKPFEFQKTDKNPATASILSFLFIGLGQAYNGEITKAVVFLILYAISIILTFFMIGFVTTPILWLWSMVDAYRSSQKMNQVGTARQSPSNASPPGLVMNVPVRD
jgi:TM2 domain-containing membrane protein YozV